MIRFPRKIVADEHPGGEKPEDRVQHGRCKCSPEADLVGCCCAIGETGGNEILPTHSCRTDEDRAERKQDDQR